MEIRMDTRVTTYTIMTANVGGKTYGITSRVIETLDSALDHLLAMHREWSGIEPAYSITRAGQCWTWERKNANGSVVQSDTVRIA